MSWVTVLVNWNVGQKIKASALNNLNAGIAELQNAPAMEQQSSASIPTGTATYVAFTTTATYSAGSGLTAVAGGVRVTRAGRYGVSGQCTMAANSTGLRGLYVGGAVYGITDNAPASGPAQLSTYTELSFNAGDNILLYAYQTSGGSLTATSRLTVRQLS